MSELHEETATMSGGDEHIVIVGSGFAGLGMAIRLLARGVTDFTVLERAAEVGGTWRDNHYPGAACDVPSALYSFSFAPNPDWTRWYAPQREILAYLIDCAEKFGVRPHIRFSTRVSAARYDEARGTWELQTNGGPWRARTLILGTGGLSRPALPEIAGLARFAGRSFHSARWDDSAMLDGGDVAVVGTGASAIQLVPQLAPRVRRLTVFQRTPPWIVPRMDGEIGPRRRALFRRVPLAQKLQRAAIYLQHEVRAAGFVLEPRLLKLASRLARRHLRASVKDPALREKLTPKYVMGCKRILPSDDYYPALTRENVALVTGRIVEVRERGVLTEDGREHPASALVLCTGFLASEAVAPFPISGRGGANLEELWRDGAEAYLGTTVSGFPNLFVIVGPNTGLGHNSMIFVIESQLAYIDSCLQEMEQRGLRALEVRLDVQARFNRRLRERLATTVWSTGGCTSWYRTRSGKNTTLWPGFTVEYRLRTRSMDPADYELTPR